VRDALKRFAEARPPGIYNTLFVVELFYRNNQLGDEHMDGFEFAKYPGYVKDQKQYKISEVALRKLGRANSENQTKLKDILVNHQQTVSFSLLRE